VFEYIEDPDLRQKAIDDYTKSIDGVKVEMKTELEKLVAESTSALKANHDRLLDEKKKLQEKFKDIKDPEEALKALQLINGNEEFQMIRDGKFEEVIQKRVSSATQQFEEDIKALNSKAENGEMTAVKYKSLYSDTVRDLELRRAAANAKVLPEAMEDVLNKGRQLFHIGDDEKTVESRDASGKLREIAGKVMTPDNWIESLKKTSPHYWPGSVGGKLNPGFSTANDLDDQIAAAAKSGDSALFRELRDKQKEARGKK